MKSEAKRQRIREKKLRRRNVLREQHLQKAKGQREMAEHDHFIRFHTAPEDLTEEQKAHPGEDHAGHDHAPVGTEQNRTQQLSQPLDVGTTRMKIDGHEDVTGVPPQGEVAGAVDPEQLRKELGLA